MRADLPTPQRGLDDEEEKRKGRIEEMARSAFSCNDDLGALELICSKGAEVDLLSQGVRDAGAEDGLLDHPVGVDVACAEKYFGTAGRGPSPRPDAPCP